CRHDPGEAKAPAVTRLPNTARFPRDMGSLGRLVALNDRRAVLDFGKGDVDRLCHRDGNRPESQRDYDPYQTLHRILLLQSRSASMLTSAARSRDERWMAWRGGIVRPRASTSWMVDPRSVSEDASPSPGFTATR